jgi:hypothetical protein
MTKPSNVKKNIFEIPKQCAKRNHSAMTLPINISRDDRFWNPSGEKRWLSLAFAARQSELSSGSVSIHTHHIH